MVEVGVVGVEASTVEPVAEPLDDVVAAEMGAAGAFVDVVADPPRRADDEHPLTATIAPTTSNPIEPRPGLMNW